MLKQLIAGAGLFCLTAIPMAAQTKTYDDLEKNHPLEAPTPENRAYQKNARKNVYIQKTGTPQYGNRQDYMTPSPAKPAADSAATVPAADDKKKPQR